VSQRFGKVETRKKPKLILTYLLLHLGISTRYAHKSSPEGVLVIILSAIRLNHDSECDEAHE